MANKRTPRKVTVTTTATLLTDRQKRHAVTFSYTGATLVSLSNNNSGFAAYADGFPMAPDVPFTDSISKDSYYAVAASGSVDVWVWEIE